MTPKAESPECRALRRAAALRQADEGSYQMWKGEDINPAESGRTPGGYRQASGYAKGRKT